MKKYIFLVCSMLMSMGHTVLAQVPETLDGGYRLVWNDEFEKPGRPDPSKWVYEHGFVRNREWQWYQSDNATVTQDGVLQITARAEDRPCPWYREGSNDWKHNRKRIECTSACVKTLGLHEFQYGRILVRARIPAARGSWPAIWMLGSKEQYGWPSCGELDIMEFYERGGVRSILANACWGNDKGGSVWNTKAIPFTHFTQKDSLWATRFHVWRTDWDKNYIRIYLDDELLNEIDLSKTINGKHGKGDNPFRAPMHLLLNMAMGSSGGKVDMEALPMRYEIDYVRVYQR